MSGISIKAVAIGVAIDLGGGLLAALGFSLVYGVVLMAQGAPVDDVQRRMLADQSFYVAEVIIGTGFLAGGALAAARIARAREVAHAGLVGVVGLVIAGGFALVSNPDPPTWPSWYMPVSFGVTLPVALLTGYVAQRFARPR
jgi:hypothetical protein